MSSSLMHRAAADGALSTEVRRWRSRWLVVSGFPPPLAAAVVADPDIDLHALLELVDRGCPPELAVRIVAPLPTAEPVR
ncbi:hypothetical protein [Nocardia asteroides]|uniref:hypothetical protein n=1 Tax=Nocardia asteroides TaxID=1824 RepID=UPI0034057332